MRKLVLVTLSLIVLSAAVPAIIFGNSLPGFSAQDNVPAAKHEASSETFAWLGVAVRPLNPRQAESLGVEQGSGLLVLHVMVDSPAQTARLQRGDIILAADDTTVKGMGDLRQVLHTASSGDTLAFSLQRGDEQMSLEAVLTRNPATLLVTRSQRLPLLQLIALLGPHLQQGEITILDSEGSPVTLSLVAGTVAAPVEDGVLRVTSAAGAELALTLIDETIIGKGHQLSTENLAIGDEVIVVMKDGVLEALWVKPLVLRPQHRPKHTVAPNSGEASASSLKVRGKRGHRPGGVLRMAPMPQLRGRDLPEFSLRDIEGLRQQQNEQVCASLEGAPPHVQERFGCAESTPSAPAPAPSQGGSDLGPSTL